MRTLLTARFLLTTEGLIGNPVVEIEDGVVRSISTRAQGSLPNNGEHCDFADATLAAAYFDVHTHGCCGHDVMEGTPGALRVIGGFLGHHGVGAYLPTTVTAPEDRILRSLADLAQRIAAPPQPGSATPLGVHLEGPFLSHAKRGAHPTRDLQEPSIPLFDRMYAAAEGRILLMTIAPELPGAMELITHATARGVRVSIGHSNGLRSDACAGIEAGAVSATHTFNAMRPLDQREPGILGTALAEDALFAEIICDGLHVDPDVVRLFARSKPADRAILVTDAMSAAGMPDGTYKLGELDVRVTAGRAITGENTLAGSTLTMNRAVENYTRFAQVPLPDALYAATRNPARMLRCESAAGLLAVGGRADLNVISPTGALQATYLGGVRVST